MISAIEAAEPGVTSTVQASNNSCQTIATLTAIPTISSRRSAVASRARRPAAPRRVASCCPVMPCYSAARDAERLRGRLHSGFAVTAEGSGRSPAGQPTGAAGVTQSAMVRV
jgi:hypothetical protein